MEEEYPSESKLKEVLGLELPENEKITSISPVGWSFILSVRLLISPTLLIRRIISLLSSQSIKNANLSLDFLKLWLIEVPSDWLDAFIKGQFSVDECPFLEFRRRLSLTLLRTQARRSWLRGVINPQLPGARPLQTRVVLSVFDWKSISPEELAHRLTWWDTKLFASLEPDHFLPHSTSSLTSLLAQRFNSLSFWVAGQLLSVDEQQTCTFLVRLIQLCRHLLDLRNYYSLSAVLHGFHHASVSRLHALWQRASPNSQVMLEQLNELFSVSMNYSNYRRTLASAPGLPFLAVHLRDLTFHLDNWRQLATQEARVSALKGFSDLLRSFYPFCPQAQSALAQIACSPPRRRLDNLQLEIQLREGLMGPSPEELMALSYERQPAMIPCPISSLQDLDLSPPTQWNTPDVCAWLKYLLGDHSTLSRHLHHLQSLARQHQWTGSQICEWDKADWHGAGVIKLGDQKLFLKDLESRLRLCRFTDWTSRQVIQWCQDQLVIPKKRCPKVQIFPGILLTLLELPDSPRQPRATLQFRALCDLGFSQEDCPLVLSALSLLHQGYWFASLPTDLLKLVPTRWNDQHIKVWFSHLGIEETIINKFRESSIIGSLLTDLTDSDFRVLGVRPASLTHQFLLAAIDHLFSNHPLLSTSSTSSSSSNYRRRLSTGGIMRRPTWKVPLAKAVSLSDQSVPNGHSKDLKMDLLSYTSALPSFYGTSSSARRLSIRQRSRSHGSRVNSILSSPACFALCGGTVSALTSTTELLSSGTLSTENCPSPCSSSSSNGSYCLSPSSSCDSTVISSSSAHHLPTSSSSCSVTFALSSPRDDDRLDENHTLDLNRDQDDQDEAEECVLFDCTPRDPLVPLVDQTSQ